MSGGVEMTIWIRTKGAVRTRSQGSGGGALASIFSFFALFCTPACAQPIENPIPVSGGALRFAEPKETSDLPNAFDAGWKGEKVCEPLFENEQMRAARCTFPPGVGHEKHWHGAHWGYVVEGATMRITDQEGGADRVVKAGSSWWSDGIAWHEVVNVGATTGVYIIVEPKGAAK